MKHGPQLPHRLLKVSRFNRTHVLQGKVCEMQTNDSAVIGKRKGEMGASTAIKLVGYYRTPDCEGNTETRPLISRDTLRQR